MMLTHARGPLVRLLTAVLTTALTLAGLVALSTAAAPSAQAAAGTVKGKVTVAGTGAPLVGMSVVAYCDEGAGWTQCEETTSGAGGAYTLDLPAGTFRIGASSTDNQYAPAFFGGTTKADAADVVPPATDIDLAMAPNATVKGRVGQGLLNAAVPNVDVCLYEKVTTGATSTWMCVTGATTRSDGTYTLWAKPGAAYRVGFSVPDNRLREVFYPNAATVETATNLALTSAGRTGINVKMVGNGKVTGTVRVQGTNAAIPGAQVRVHELVANGTGSTWQQTRTTTTDAAGSYEIYLDNGTYRLGFDAGSTYQATFWNGKDSVATATDVTVANGATVAGISPLLTRNAKITGTVTAEAGGAPIAGAQVAALRQVTKQVGGETRTVWEAVAWAKADAAGAYQLAVPAGTYRVSFDDPCDATACADVYQTEYWNNATDVESAANVVVAGSGTFGERNGSLAKNGLITGTVTAQTGGAPLRGIAVVARDQRTYQSGGQTRTEWVTVGRATTDADGHYTLPAAPGTHKIEFSQTCSGAACRYLGEFYDDAATIEAATGVTVTAAGATTPGIDAALASGSLISGKLTGKADAAVAGAKVTAYRQQAGAWKPLASVTSGADGKYAVLVPDGDVRVGFSDADARFTEEFYDDSLTLAGADTIAVGGADVPGIDATLGLQVVNTAVPTIPDADPQVGETITAGNGTWSVTPDAYSYRWFQAGTLTTIGTERDLVVPAGALGKKLVVEVTAKKAAHADGVATSAPSDAVAQGVLTSTAKPTISGAVTVGSTVQALEGTWSATPDAYTYRWFQAGTAASIGTGKELVVPAGAAGKALTVEVTAKRAGFTDGVASSDPSAAVAPGGLANSAKPTISGDLKVGSTVTAGDGTWAPAPDAFTYRWFQAGNADPIGTAKELVIPVSALGKALTVEVTAAKAGYGNSTAVSDPSALVALGTMSNTAKPTITGAVKVGGTVTAADGTWSPAAGSYLYKWFQEGSTEPIGTTKNLVVPVGALGKKLTVEVTARKLGYASDVVTSDPSAAVGAGDLASGTAPAVTGTVQVGKTVTAEPGTWTPAATGHAYRWFQSGSTDPIGTGKDLVVPAGAAGKTLTVEVTASAPGYADGVATSPASAPVALGDLANETEPTVTGTAQVGKTVTAVPGAWTPAADGYTYRWFRSGSTDPVGTGQDLVVPGAAAGETLTVEVTATKAGYADSAAVSEPTAAVTKGVLTNTVKPTITGTVAVGGTVQPNDGTWSQTPDSYTYKWFLSGASAPISTDRQLVIPSGAAGKTLRVEVTATKAGYADASASSDPLSVAVPAAQAPVNTVKPAITGKAKVGQTLTVSTGTWSPAPSTLAYQWFANGVRIPNATGNRLTLTPALATKVIQVLVGAAVPGAAGFEWSNTTKPVALGTLTVTGRPTLTGTAKVGSKLKVVVPRATTPAGATVTIQWLLGGKPIPKANRKALKLNSPLYRGKKVQARVTYTLKGYAPVVLTTAKVKVK
ncbi:hypothetical protein GUY44_02530 [Pimelobacter simplex]|uniref:Alkaline phosphatase n=1 Tax=Nocardioides simplex TaxID=2045 RepID=A0A0A1DPB7_NOCSI|nr:hypothetical protein [Pimelobacter simplex]AIY19261.1 Alkaline phosphatase [Pimelobacter simplex]MCG8149340.1 hypothetical protein [Pimelobacter simplex]GEB16532.1 hypothetical protein NSI01_48470 [Pimelobacter simplex]SFM20361.1 Carboxypeptidase regulatory-like domain-containing protein [Pimelobacter simplex]